MRNIQKRVLLQIALGFLLGRVVLFDRNPVGAAYFVAGFVQGGAALPVGIAVCLGMITVLPVEAVLRYSLSMVSVGIAADLLRHRQIRVKMGHCALIMAVMLGVFSAIQLSMMPFLPRDIVFGAADIILVLVFSRVLYEGQGYLLHARHRPMDNEEMISLIIIGAMAVYGLPDILIGDVFLPELAIYLFLPVIGYQYGAGMGAVAGAAGGILLALFGQDSDCIGMLCLLGICAGMLRRQGKVWMLSAFLMTAVALGYIVCGQIPAEGTLKAIIIDGIVLLLIPDRYLRKIRFPRGLWEEKWSREELGGLMKYKLEDYARSFQELSKVMRRESRSKEGIDRRDMRRLMQDMSEQICGRCEHRNSCMGQAALGRPETLGNLALAQEQGSLILEQMPAEFARECIHPQRFLSETNQNIRMARMLMGFQNRMAQNRQVIAGQMEQVGQLLGELAEDMLHIRPVSGELEEEICKGLSSMNVSVKNLAFYENKEGRMEVHMLAGTVRGRLATAKEAAGVLAEITGKPFVVSAESRHVIPHKETRLVFQEDTSFHAVTGVARIPKEGEEISGDTFTCLYLPNGELLLALSDGMGSGEEAMEESQTVIELLEQMTEAGFSKIAAMKLINSLYLPEDDNTSYATADVSILNLYEGTCQFVKNGAAATWIRHEREVERVEGQSLPVGILQEAEPYFGKSRISSGDYVIMMTDGVSDAFAQREKEWEQFLLRCRAVNPQEMAEQILEEAVSCQDTVKDDMSVIVAGVWEQ